MAIPESLQHIFDTEAQYQSYLAGELSGAPVADLAAATIRVAEEGVFPLESVGVDFAPMAVIQPKLDALRRGDHLQEVPKMAEFWYPDEPQGAEPPPGMVQAGLPLIPIITTGAALTVGAIKWLIQQYGQSAVFQRIAQLVGVSAATAVISKVVASLNDNQKVTLRRRRRRYSIGSNPRVGTLIKVAKFTDKLTRKMHNRFRHAGLIKMPRRHTYHPYHKRRH